ncbi:MAG: DUF3791 domain-containing protein [Roseburia sp.]|nr:DUF3791 domain-containing protein [Roseburia sp.]MCM1278899.1 DUF3791 domain-containing protein [Robinsoniella sp.]
MNERQQIIYMQTRIIRLASEKWNRPIEEIVVLFAKNNVLQYIEEYFGIFHVEGDEAVLEDVITYLKNKGVTGNAGIGG